MFQPAAGTGMGKIGSEEAAGYLIAPDPAAEGLTRRISGMTQNGEPDTIRIVEERPLTIFLNGSEILTAMTVGDYPDLLALGFLYNQGIIRNFSEIASVDFEAELETVVVRTIAPTNHEQKQQRKMRTSGCAMGTVFGDLFDQIEAIRLPGVAINSSWLYALAATINRTPSLYLEAGAIHGTVLCKEDQPLVYMEDVGRHNAVDKVSGWMLVNRETAADKILYTTGRLTSEMVLKTAMMGIPALVSRSGFTAWGVEIARRTGMTLIGRLRGRRYICLSGEERLVRDADPSLVPEEPAGSVRKSARDRQGA